MLEALFGNKNIEKILFFLLVNEKCFASELKQRFQTALSPIQKSLDKLETAGILVSFPVGKTRVFQFNPRYAFLNELRAFIARAYKFLPDKIKAQYYEPAVRKRPRKRAKPL
jgi:predicted transcriptional regulator